MLVFTGRVKGSDNGARTDMDHLVDSQSTDPKPFHSAINALNAFYTVRCPRLCYRTDCYHRAREVLLVPGGGKWRLRASMFLFLEACSKFSEHGRPRFPRGTTNIR